MERLTGRMPTHGGAAIIVVVGLFVGLLVAQTAVRLLDVQGAGALVLELLIVGILTVGTWVSLPDRWFTPWQGLYSGNEIEPWESPTDKRIREDRERAEAAGATTPPRDRRAARDASDPRDDPDDRA
jgi:hypothetical protein